MAKAVFRAGELSVLSERLVLTLPDTFSDLSCFPGQEEEEQDEAAQEVYSGPTAEELRQEAEEFRIHWEAEREAIINAVRADVENAKHLAAISAEEEKHQKTAEAEAIVAAAREEAEKIIAEAESRVREEEAQSRGVIENERIQAVEKGREDGHAEGYAEGRTEVDRLIQRTQLVLERAQDKRGEILAETEQQIIDLVLLMTRKVVKVISDSQRSVIISNVAQALRKVRDRGNIIIRVNLSDVKLTTDHTKDFIKMLEGVKSIQVQEDSSVDSGGCIIETDFGEIDARISSQLAELEAKILEVSPIKSKIKERKT